MTGNGSEKAKDRIEDARNAIEGDLQELARQFRERAEETRKGIIGSLNDASAKLRQEAREAGLPEEAIEGIDGFLNNFERAANYLQNTDAEQVVKDVAEGAKQNIVPISIILFIIGLVIGVILRGDSKSSANKR